MEKIQRGRILKGISGEWHRFHIFGVCTEWGDVAEGVERGRMVLKRLERLGGRLKVRDGHFGKTWR
jgi:hypothetical protein